MTRLSAWLLAIRQVLCGLRRYGHSEELRFGWGRLYPFCVDCGRETPGVSWTLAPPPPKMAKVVRFQKRIQRLV
jgi:hypothetical protein